MKKKSKLIYAVVMFLLNFFLIVGMAHGQIPVQIFESSHSASAALDALKISQIVTREFHLDEPDTPFRSADVKVIYSDTQPDYLIVHLKDKLTWSFETARVELDNGYTVSGVEMDYTLTEKDLGQDVKGAAYCPDSSVKMVFATCETDVPSAVEGVDYAAGIAEKAGYKVKVLKGAQENKKAYEDWLSCHDLILWGRIGHGSPEGISVADGIVPASTFSDSWLKAKVFYFNSCKVHNNPLKDAIKKAGILRFVGGICNLKIGPSEEVFKCWMEKIIAGKKEMTPTLDLCEQTTNYPEPGCHGITGNSSIDVLIDDINPKPEPHPTTCEGYCGGEGVGGCYCDDSCENYGDCCPDKKQFCGY